MNEKVFIKKWIKAHKYCVIATCAKGKPWAATVNYTSDNEMNIYLSTNPMSLKYKNTLENPVVCLVIDSQNREGTLQIQGIAKSVVGELFKEPNLVVKPEFLMFKKKDEKTGKLILIQLKN